MLNQPDVVKNFFLSVEGFEGVLEEGIDLIFSFFEFVEVFAVFIKFDVYGVLAVVKVYIQWFGA